MRSSFKQLELTAVLLTVFVGCSKSAEQPARENSPPPQVTQAPEKEAEKKSKREHMINDVATLELKSATAHKFNQDVAFVVTLKVKRKESVELPPAAKEPWIWVGYLSGTPDPEEPKGMMLNNVDIPDAPKGRDFRLFAVSPLVDEKKFRFDESALILKPKSGEASDRHLFFMSTIMSRDDKSWSLDNPQEISFPIPNVDTAVGLEGGLVENFRKKNDKKLHPESRGVAAICLCGFQDQPGKDSKLVLLSQMITVTLDPAEKAR